MKKIIILLLLALPLHLLAQSSMTDLQVASYIQQEMKRGTSQSQIVTHLMQSGVDISQIRRVRKAYERAKDGAGLGEATASRGQGQRRLRQANGVGKQARATSKPTRSPHGRPTRRGMPRRRSDWQATPRGNSNTTTRTPTSRDTKRT